MCAVGYVCIVTYCAQYGDDGRAEGTTNWDRSEGHVPRKSCRSLDSHDLAEIIYAIHWKSELSLRGGKAVGGNEANQSYASGNKATYVRSCGTNFLCVCKKWCLIKRRVVLYFRFSISSTSLSMCSHLPHLHLVRLTDEYLAKRTLHFQVIHHNLQLMWRRASK